MLRKNYTLVSIAQTNSKPSKQEASSSSFLFVFPESRAFSTGEPFHVHLFAKDSIVTGCHSAHPLSLPRLAVRRLLRLRESSGCASGLLVRVLAAASASAGAGSARAAARVGPAMA